MPPGNDSPEKMLSLLREAERERQAAEARLRVVERHLEAAERFAHIGGWRLDAATGLVESSAQHLAIYGLSSEGAPYPLKVFIEATHVEDVARVSREFELAALDGAPRNITYRITRGDGEARLLDVHFQVRSEGGRPVETFGTTQDITERQQMQEQLAVAERLASLGTLAAGVAHEINNPLAALMGHLEMLLRAGSGADDGTRAENLQVMKEAAERIRDVARDLRVFARSESDTVGPVDVAEVLESSLRLAGHQLRHRARIVRRFRDVPPVLANASRLGQVFLNLLVNAGQAIEEGHVDRNAVTVAIEVCGDSRVAIDVTDTGPGIPASRLPRLFQPFSTTKAEGHGTGLGLAICHRIVTQFGGTITARSVEGQGATFRIELPVSTAPSAPAPAPAPSTRPPADQLRVLIVDDDSMVRRALRELLDVGFGVETEEADSAADALSRIRGGARYDAILSDLMMPRMSGPEFFLALKEVAPEQSERLAFVTGGAFTASAAAFLEAYPQPVLEKPITIASLGRMLACIRGPKA
jgi:signal transduction histidine kinase